MSVDNIVFFFFSFFFFLFFVLVSYENILISIVKGENTKTKGDENKQIFKRK